jgi:hypothetical protein
MVAERDDINSRQFLSKSLKQISPETFNPVALYNERLRQSFKQKTENPEVEIPTSAKSFH